MAAGLRTAVLQALEAKFAPLPEKIVAAVNSLTADEATELLKKVIAAETLAELNR